MPTVRRLWPATLHRPRLSRVAGGILIVGSATALGQGALVLAAPILARLYDPAAFGLLSVYSALLSVLVAGSSLRFDLAIPMAKDAREALHILVLSIGLGFVSSIVLAIGILAGGGQLAKAVGVAPLIPFLWLLPLALFVASGAQALSSWAVYLRDFSALGRLRATQGIGQALCQVAFGMVGASPVGLIVGDVVGRVAGVERLLGPFRAAVRSTPLSRSAIAGDARARWSFARVMTVASLINALSLQLPFLLIPVLFGLDSSGQYFLAYRVLILPASLVGAAVSQVFFGEASFRSSDPERLRVLARSATVSLFVFSIPTYGVAAVAGSVLVRAVFGARWETAGLFAQVMAPWIVLSSVASPISTLLLIGRRERESLAFTTAELILIAGSLAVGALVHSLIVGIAVLSMTSVFLQIGALWRFLRVASVSLNELMRPVGRIALLTLPLLVVLILIGSWPPLVVLAASFIGAVSVIAVSAWTTPELRTFVSSAHD
jgi:lipopolysaccharide exporter